MTISIIKKLVDREKNIPSSSISINNNKRCSMSSMSESIKKALRKAKTRKSRHERAKLEKANSKKLFWSNARIRHNERKYRRKGMDSRSHDFIDIEQASVVIKNTIKNSGSRERLNIYADIKKASHSKSDIERQILIRLTPDHFV